MPVNKATSVQLLEDDFKTRKSRNSRYSMRSYAQLLGISSGRISEILSGKCPLSVRQAQRIVTRIGWSGDKVSHFLNIVEQEESSLKRMRQQKKEKRHRRLSLDEFALIADWEHFAVLSLLETKNAEPTTKWISQRLRLGRERVAEILDRLVRYGYLQQEGDRFQLSQESTQTPSDIPSKALRESHRQTIGLALEKLESAPVETRDITSMTMAIDLKRLPEAKKMIYEFRQKLSRFLEKGNRGEVYLMNVQLVPLSEIQHD